MDLDVNVPDVGAVGFKSLPDEDATRPIRPGPLLPTLEMRVDTGAASLGWDGTMAAGALATLRVDCGMPEVVTAGLAGAARFHTFCTMVLAEDRNPKRDASPFFSVLPSVTSIWHEHEVE